MGLALAVFVIAFTLVAGLGGEMEGRRVAFGRSHPRFPPPHAAQALAATSYLTRLGYITADGVNPVYGAPLMIADHVFNLLDSSLLQVEDKAQSIIEATFKQEALRKIGWFFY